MKDGNLKVLSSVDAVATSLMKALDEKCSGDTFDGGQLHGP